MAYNYGKSFRKNGKLVRYRYTNGRKSTKKLVGVNSRGRNRRGPPRRGNKGSRRKYFR